MASSAELYRRPRIRLHEGGSHHRSMPEEYINGRSVLKEAKKHSAHLCRHNLKLRDATFRVNFQMKSTHPILMTVSIVMLHRFKEQRQRWRNNSPFKTYLTLRRAGGCAFAAAGRGIKFIVDSKRPHFLMRTVGATRKFTTAKRRDASGAEYHRAAKSMELKRAGAVHKALGRDANGYVFVGNKVELGNRRVILTIRTGRYWNGSGCLLRRAGKKNYQRD